MATFQGGFAYQILDLFADNEEFALKIVLVGTGIAPAYKNLFYNRFRGQDTDAQAAIIDRHFAPSNQLLAFRSYQLFQLGDTLIAAGFILRQEQHANGVGALFRQLQTRFGPEELIRYLQQDPRAIASLGIGPNRTAVGQAIEYFQPLVNDLVTFVTFDVGNESDTAGIMFICRVVQPLFCG
jgi:hypothetical protein